MNDVTNMFGPDDPETEERLARALRHEADTIEPGSRLAAIRAEGRRGRTGRLVGIAAAAMVGAVMAGLVVGALVQRPGPNTAANHQDREPMPAASSVAEPGPTPQGTPGSTTNPPASSSTSPSSPAGTTANGPAAPVYWLGPDDKLFREYLPPVRASDSRVVAAIETMLAGSPLDPDYRAGPWQEATGVKVSQSGQDLTIDIPAAAFADDEVSAEVAQQALQQLIYTATAAVQTQGTVTVLIDGKPGTAWGTVEVGTAMKRDVAARAPVWITKPQQGESRKAGSVTIEGVATAFEGTVVWKVTREDGSVVKESHTMAGANGKFATYSFELELDPGTYVVTVTAEDASGRTDGSSDNKTFTVA